MISQVAAENIEHSIIGFIAEHGVLAVRFTNPYGLDHHEHHVIPVTVEQDGELVYDADATNQRILDQRRGIAKNMWLKYQQSLEGSSGVSDTLAGLFGVIGGPVSED